ncbi:hypothetical protein, partial [Streptococcus agalactiae]|uniref:hypothetical protein n=1 Tax=Streptococcus agalactiae TaxID=1311 RepID=UPI001C58BE8A
VSQLYYTGFIPFCVYTRYFTLPIFIEQSQFEIFIYIEIDHNSSSPHVALDYQSQKEFEKIITNYLNFITAFA